MICGKAEFDLASGPPLQKPEARVKRLFDLLLTLPAAVLLFPVLLLTAAAIRLTSPGPAVHWSRRVGRDNQIFLMPKFRTMRTDTPQVPTHLLTDPGRWVTPIGRILRRTSLDELPQLWSVLCGDMSLVGPRPALFNQDDLVALRTEVNVHKLRPGVTGWAQVNGRDELPIPIKVDFDDEYRQRQSLLMDIRIIFETLRQAVQSKGVSH
jgi:O-antigen biosynthesis protein WbqP